MSEQQRTIRPIPLSKSLYFMLLDNTDEFSWQPYLDNLLVDLRQYGIDAEAADRSKATTAVKKGVFEKGLCWDDFESYPSFCETKRTQDQNQARDRH